MRALTLLAAMSVLAFALAEWAPGDFLSPVRADPSMAKDVVEGIETRMGLDRPWPARYLRWCGSMLSGDLGESLAYGVPVRTLVSNRLTNTVWLNLAATCLAWAAAGLLGSIAGANSGSWFDRAVSGTQALLLGVPELLTALVALWWFGGEPWLALPILVLGATPSLVIHVRASVGEALGHTAVRAARLHRIRGPRLWWSYVMPLAAPPLVSLAGVTFGGLLSGSLLVEATLSYPGLGTLMLEAIRSRDTPVVAAITVVAGAMLIAGNTSARLLHRALDPRLSREAR